MLTVSTVMTIYSNRECLHHSDTGLQELQPFNTILQRQMLVRELGFRVWKCWSQFSLWSSSLNITTCYRSGGFVCSYCLEEKPVQKVVKNYQHHCILLLGLWLMLFKMAALVLNLTLQTSENLGDLRLLF